jgi:MIZ/SP-RING zinc finger
MEEIFCNLNSNELKNICKRLNLKQSGSKDNLCTQIIKFLNSTHGRTKAEGIVAPEILSMYDILVLQGSLNSTSKNEKLSSCICNNEKGMTISCHKCHKIQHLKCISNNYRMLPYLCPQCLLEKISPLDQPVEVLIPAWQQKEVTYFGSSSYAVTEKTFEYKIAMKDVIVEGRGTNQIQLRCIKLDGKSFFMCWPSKGHLIVNGKIAMRFETSSNPNAKKRKDELLNITTILTPGKNEIGIYQINDPNVYAVGLFLVSRKSEIALISEIRSNNCLSVEKSKEFIFRTLASGDQDIQSKSIKFSLRCPITMTLMEIPVRGSNCSHIQCFNLAPYVFLQPHSKVNRWRCPTCNNFVYDMIVDLFILEIVEQAKLTEEPQAVEIFKDTTYKIISLNDWIASNKKNEDRIPAKRASTSDNPQAIKAPKIEKSQEIIEL